MQAAGGFEIGGNEDAPEGSGRVECAIGDDHFEEAPQTGSSETCLGEEIMSVELRSINIAEKELEAQCCETEIFRSLNYFLVA